MDPVKRKKNEELKQIFHLAVRFFKRKKFDIARQGFEIIVRQAEDEEKGFLARIFKGPSLRKKAFDYLKIIPLRQVQVKEKTIKAAETVLETDRERFIKKHEEELQEQKKGIAEKYEKKIKEQLDEIIQKKKKVQIEEAQISRKVALGHVAESDELQQKLIEQERELEKRKDDLQKKYEQELEKAKKTLEERQADELKKWGESLKEKAFEKRQQNLNQKKEELNKQEEEARKLQESVQEKALSGEEEKKRGEVILKMGKDLQEKRRMIEEEAKKIEQEEIARKEMQEKSREDILRREETEAEKEKRRAWLRGAIQKDEEMMSPEEILKRRKEKTEEFKKLFKEALFYYKERDFDRAIEIFQELKKDLPEPKKDPGFFARIFGKKPLYIQIEDYISKIEKQKSAEEKIKAKSVRERARMFSKEKQRKKYQQPFSRLKRKTVKFFPFSPAVIFKKILFSLPLVAVDISDYSIEILRLNKNLAISAYGRSLMQEDIVRDGEIKNQKDLSQAFKFAVSQAGFKPFKPKKGPIMRGIVSVPEYKTNVQVFVFESRDNIFDKVKEEIKKTVPFPVEELYWDYIENWEEKTGQSKVLCVAVLKETIDEQIYFLKSSGVEPVIFDIEANSIGRALLPERPAGERQNLLILDVGAKITNINIFDEKGFISSSTSTSVAGHYLIEKIVDYFGISQEEAETVINLRGFRKENNAIRQVLEEGMENIVKETREVIHHYQRKTGNEIKKIILAGGTAMIPEIDVFLKNKFQGVKIEIGDPLKKVKRKGGLDPDKALLYANAIGLALRGTVKDPLGAGINLLPDKIKEKEKKVYWQRHKQKLLAIKIVLVVVIIAALLLVYLYLFDDFLK